MYAVFRTGGKQYRASAGDTLKVEKLDADEGAKVQFDEVLMVGEGDSVTVGTPLVPGGKVAAKVLGQDKDRKIDVVKFKRRKGYRVKTGHRQPALRVRISDIKS